MTASCTTPDATLLEAEALAAKWERFNASHSKESLGELVSHYMPLVNNCAQKMSKRFPRTVEVDDLKSGGALGLMAAIKAYEPGRGVSFVSFAFHRIRGGIIDEVRSMDWLPRSARNWCKKIDEARERLRRASGRKASNEEIAEEVGLNPRQCRQLPMTHGGAPCVSLNQPGSSRGGENETDRAESVADPAQADPSLRAQREELKHIVTTGLSRSERLIVLLYYYEGMTLAEIGLTLDISESRACQILSSVIARLRERMQDPSRFD
jgi:RNA polymerase sigma factor for flagellar operon FliA